MRKRTAHLLRALAAKLDPPSYWQAHLDWRIEGNWFDQDADSSTRRGAQ